MSVAARTHRTCQVTGFLVDLAAERLIIWNAVAAVVALAAGGVMALLIALTRWQAVHLLPPDWFYRLVTAHGATMLVFWIVFFEVAGLYFGSTVLLNARMVAPRVGWGVFAAMVLGAGLAEYTMLAGQATVMFTAYPPLEASPLFYLGVLLFAGGALVAVGLFFANLITARRERTYEGSLPLVTYALLAAAVIAVFALLSGAVAYLSLFLKSVGLVAEVDPGTYRLVFWGFGHGAQQINLAAMVGVWYALSGLTVGGWPVNEALSRVAFLLYVAFINLGSMHHLLVDPGLGTSSRIMNASYFIYLAVLASLIHAFSIPASVEVAQRQRGYTRGLFGWLRHAPWREPGFSALAVSLVWFGFVAGVTGVLLGTMQLNMIGHNTLLVPGHFHATVVAGTTLAFMGLAYYLVPLVTRRQLLGVAVARWQPYVFGLGLALLSGGMVLAGRLGVPRRVWDITYTGAPLAVDVFRSAQVEFSMLLVGLGAIISVVGGAMFVGVMVATVFLGRRSEHPVRGLRLALGAEPGLVGGVLRPVAGGSQEADVPAGATGAGRRHGVEAPGTLALALVFLVWFVLMYAIAFFRLSRAWPVA